MCRLTSKTSASRQIRWSEECTGLSDADGIAVTQEVGVRDLAQTIQVIGHWEHFGHGADIGVRGIGATMAESFEQAAVALTAVITDPAKVVAKHQIRIPTPPD